MSRREAELYEALHRGNDGDIAFYVGLADGASSTLELGAGYGRVLDALAPPANDPTRARFVGLELDDALRARARARLGDRAMLVAGDMRDFALHRRFDRIFAPHSALYCLCDARELSACLAAVRAHLTEDGLFTFDAWPTDAFHRDARPDDMDEDTLEHVVDVTLAENADGCSDDVTYRVFERSRWDREAQRLDVTYVYTPVAGAVIEHEIRQRYLLAAEIEPLLAGAGLALVSLCGGFAGEAYDDDAEALVVTARPA